MFSFGKKKGPTFAFDINSDNVSVLQLEHTKAGVELARFAVLPTPPNTVREGLIVDPEAAGAVLKEVAQLAGISFKGQPPAVNVIVPGQSVVVRLMPIPTGMPPEELADVVAQEAINHIPFPMREANLDWSIMPATERMDPDGVQRVDVMVAAVQKTIVDAYWRAVDAAGVKLGRIDISALAATRALSFAGYFNQPDVLTMLVNIRHDATDINLVKNGMQLFSRSVLLGVDTLGEAVARSLDVQLDEALSLLPQVQLFGMAQVEPRLGQAAQIARTVFGDITDEVGRSLEFYRSQVGEVSIEQILLCGPGCIVPQVDQFMSNRLNLKTYVADPFKGIVASSVTVAEQQRTSLTMAVGAVTDPVWLPVPVVELDLNKEGPSEGMMGEIQSRPTVRVVEEAEAPWFMPAIMAGVALLVIFSGVWAYFTQYDVPKKQNELVALEGELNTGNNQLKGLGKLKDDNALLARKKELLDAIINKGNSWSTILQVIADATPPGVQVKKVTLLGSNLVVEGVAVDFTKPAYLAVNLGGSPFLFDATVNSAARELQTDARVINFNVSAKIRSGEQAEQRIAAKPQFLDFYADWCGPCKQVKPVFEEAKHKWGDKVDFVLLNVDDPANRPLVEKYKVKAVPNLCFLNGDGKLVEQIVGFEGPEPIWAALEKVGQVASSGYSK